MLECTQWLAAGSEGLDLIDRVELAFDTRKKSRFRTHTLTGQEIGVVLPRGHVLEHGQLLVIEGQEAQAVLIEAAQETVSEVRCDDALLLMRIAYHLGNRHVPLQIERGVLRYQHDHVLDQMAQGLGAQVSVTQAPFHPEDGAYKTGLGGGAHGHHHHHD
jgi:urease accessory protein